MIIQHVIDAVSIAINKEFNSPLLSMEDVKQSLKPGSFVLKTLETSRTDLPNNQFRLHVPLDIHYFNVSEESAERERLEVQDKLYQILRIITDTEGISYRASDMSARTVDNVLHFFVTYTVVCRYEDDGIKMQRIEKNTVTVKEEDNGS